MEEEDELISDEEDKGYLNEKFWINLLFQILNFFLFLSKFTLNFFFIKLLSKNIII